MMVGICMMIEVLMVSDDGSWNISDGNGIVETFMVPAGDGWKCAHAGFLQVPTQEI